MWRSVVMWVLYPAAGFAKSDVIDYYSRIAPVMLGHPADRPVTFVRYPDGVGGPSFFNKHVRKGAPEWLRTIRVPRTPRAKEGEKRVDLFAPLLGARRR